MKKTIQWIMFAISAIGHPLIFWSFVFFSAHYLQKLGIPVMRKMGDNVIELNIVTFVIYALLIYFIMGKLLLLLFKRIKGFNGLSYVRSQVFCDLFVGLPGLVNVYFWVQGMEGNIFGFVFFLPMLALSIISLIILIVEISRAYSGSFSK